MASARSLDPYQMRRRLLAGKPDWLKVLDTAAEKGDWGKPLPKGSGRGIAICVHMGSDRAIHKPLEQPPCTIHGVASEPLGSKTKATLDTINHGLGNGYLFNAIGACAFRIDDDADLIVDQVVCIVGKVWIYTRPGNPSRLWISQRDFLGRLAST
jgi:hypothetical protein